MKDFLQLTSMCNYNFPGTEMEPIWWNDPNTDGEWDVKVMSDQTTSSLMSIMFAVLMSELNLRLYLTKAVRCCWCPAGGLDAFNLQPCLRISMWHVFMMNVKGHDRIEVTTPSEWRHAPLRMWTVIRENVCSTLCHWHQSIYDVIQSTAGGSTAPAGGGGSLLRHELWVNQVLEITNASLNSWLSAKDANVALGHRGVNIMLKQIKPTMLLNKIKTQWRHQ